MVLRYFGRPGGLGNATAEKVAIFEDHLESFSHQTGPSGSQPARSRGYCGYRMQEESTRVPNCNTPGQGNSARDLMQILAKEEGN